MGGKIADKENKENNLKLILICTSIFVILIPFIQKDMLMNIFRYIKNIKIGAIISTLLLFFIPSLCMGCITPIITRLKINDLETAGKSTGRINAIATIGGITGTFLGGFVLIPNIGSSNILFVLTIILVLLIPLINFKIKEKSSIYVIAIIIVSLISLKIYTDLNNTIGDEILDNKNGEYVSYDTEYGRVLIYNSKLNNENIRILNIDSGYESATFTDDNKVNELVFDYTKYYDLMFNANIEINNTLLIGGAGYSYPKYYISHFENKNMDVVEIDGGITEIAKKYFYLDKLLVDYDIQNNKRLNLITEDGRTYLNKNTKKYDAILNDAFSGNSPAKTLTTIENIKNVKKSLNKNGVYLTNIISSLDGEKSKFLKAEVNTLQHVFKNVYVIPCHDNNDVYSSQNNMVIATDDNLSFEHSFKLNIMENEIVITDEYCPIDTLIPKV